MTTPRERTAAVQRLEAAALAVLDDAKRAHLDPDRVYAHVSTELLRSLSAALRHYPGTYHLEQAHKYAPEVFGAPV